MSQIPMRCYSQSSKWPSLNAPVQGVLAWSADVSLIQLALTLHRGAICLSLYDTLLTDSSVPSFPIRFGSKIDVLSVGNTKVNYRKVSRFFMIIDCCSLTKEI